jgi:hypothetical protein
MQSDDCIRVTTGSSPDAQRYSGFGAAVSSIDVVMSMAARIERATGQWSAWKPRTRSMTARSMPSSTARV